MFTSNSESLSRRRNFLAEVRAKATKRQPKPISHYEDEFWEYAHASLYTDFKRCLDRNEELHSVEIDYSQILGECPGICEDLPFFSLKILPACDAAAKRVLNVVHSDLRNSQRLNHTWDWNCRTLRVRIKSLPEEYGSWKFNSMPSPKHVGKFGALTGKIIRVGKRKLLQFCKKFHCSECGDVFDVHSELSMNYTFSKQIVCPSGCVKGNRVPLPTRDDEEKGNYTSSKHRYYQEVKLEEFYTEETTGAPRTMVVVLEDDLVEKCKRGDAVTIKFSGTVVARWKKLLCIDQPTDVELVFAANHLVVDNDEKNSIVITNESRKTFRRFWKNHRDDPYAGRNLILKSLAPDVFGMFPVKLALGMVLCGGLPENRDGTKARGDVHLLLVGDPGTGKSQILQFVKKLCVRCILTTGVGTTNAGLTVSATKSGNDFLLEPGAFVLADGGVLCIDELSSLKAEDRPSLLDAMEDQTICPAKGGTVTKFNTRCTVIACMNPMGEKGPEISLQARVGLEHALLSRFDIILELHDEPSGDWDSLLADFVLRGVAPTDRNEDVARWSLEDLQRYFAIAKELRPIMSRNAARVLAKYYHHQRAVTKQQFAKQTARLFFTLKRLSECHARLMHRNRVTIHDAYEAIAMLEVSGVGCGLSNLNDSAQAEFPDSPLELHKLGARVILTKLGLFHLWDDDHTLPEEFFTETQDDQIDIQSLIGDPEEPRSSDTVDRSVGSCVSRQSGVVVDDVDVAEKRKSRRHSILSYFSSQRGGSVSPDQHVRSVVEDDVASDSQQNLCERNESRRSSSSDIDDFI